jgi:hypothetical protein
MAELGLQCRTSWTPSAPAVTIAAGDTCHAIKTAYKASACCTSNLSMTTMYSVTGS